MSQRKQKTKRKQRPEHLILCFSYFCVYMMFESEEEEGRLRQFDLKRKTHELVPKFKSIWLKKISGDAIC